MKKLFRTLVVLAVLGAILWLTRKWLLPAPPPPETHPPPFRHPEPGPATAPASPETPDALEVIKGIGPVYKERLADMGITTFSGLVAADSETIADRLDVGVAAVVDWKTQATEHLG